MIRETQSIELTNCPNLSNNNLVKKKRKKNVNSWMLTKINLSKSKERKEFVL